MFRLVSYLVNTINQTSTLINQPQALTSHHLWPFSSWPSPLCILVVVVGNSQNQQVKFTIRSWINRASLLDSNTIPWDTALSPASLPWSLNQLNCFPCWMLPLLLFSSFSSSFSSSYPRLYLLCLCRFWLPAIFPSHQLDMGILYRIKT